jgi:agmatine/peptidylarginine deiminase
MLDEVERCYVDIATAIVRHARLVVVGPDAAHIADKLSHLDITRITIVEMETNDTWARDFGVITTVDGNGAMHLNDFKFNGWGLKFAANHDNLVTRRLIESGVLAGKYDNRLGFVLEGGSIESDGEGTILTTSNCLLSPNRNGDLLRSEIEERLGEYLGARRVLWVEHGDLVGDDTDSHIDTLARLADKDTIVYVGCADRDDEHYECLAQMKADLRMLRREDGNPYNLIELPLPDAIYDEDGQRLPATYANFLIVNDAVLVPVYGQPDKDDLALKLIKVAFGDREVVGVDCRALIKQHGSLHCVTMQIPAAALELD